MSEYIQQIIDYVMSGVAAIGGIGAVIAIATTIVKTWGGNSVKAKIASSKVDLDKTLANGLNAIQDKINTDITVDISAQVNTAVERQMRELRESENYLKEEINAMRIGLATVIDCEIERRNRLKQNADELIEKATDLRDITPVEREMKAKAQIYISTENTLTTQANETSEAKEKKPERAKVVI